MKELTNAEIKKLKKMSNTLDPVVQIGKNGLNQAVFDTIKKELENHELIKVKFIQHKESKKEMAYEISEMTESSLIRQVGNIITLYKENPDTEKRKVTF